MAQARARFDQSLHARDAAWITCALRIPAPEIAFVTAVMEAYDNEFILRTDSPGNGDIRVWCAADQQENLQRVIADLRVNFPVEVTGYTAGMAALEEIFPDEA